MTIENYQNSAYYLWKKKFFAFLKSSISIQLKKNALPGWYFDEDDEVVSRIFDFFSEPGSGDFAMFPLWLSFSEPFCERTVSSKTIRVAINLNKWTWNNPILSNLNNKQDSTDYLQLYWTNIKVLIQKKIIFIISFSLKAMWDTQQYICLHPIMRYEKLL